MHGTNSDCTRLPGFETDALTDKLIRYMDRPFFAVLSVFPPHNPYLAPEQFAEGLCAENIKLRSNVPNVPWVKQQAQRELAGYYAMVRNLDWNVGRLVQALDKLNLADDTYIVFFSDHGDMHGSHGWFRKTNPYEESCRGPFIISTGHGCMYSVAPGLLYGANNACLCDAPLNHVDVAPHHPGLVRRGRAGLDAGVRLFRLCNRQTAASAGTGFRLPAMQRGNWPPEQHRRTMAR